MSNEAATAKNDEATTSGTTDEMTNEEKSFLMKALWSSLIEPKWTKDDLIDFGKAIFSKKSFKDMTDAEFAKVFPFLTQITASFGKKLMEKRNEVEAAKSGEETAETESAQPAAEPKK